MGGIFHIGHYNIQISIVIKVKDFQSLTLSSFIGTGVVVLSGIMISSFTADIVDEQEHKTGFRQEGLFYAVESFAGKAVGGMGSLIGGVVLDLVAFPSGAAPGAVPDDAFSVHVGLGETMTSEDILEGILRVTVLVAVSRPAEFIEITFQQQMQKS